LTRFFYNKKSVSNCGNSSIFAIFFLKFVNFGNLGKKYTILVLFRILNQLRFCLGAFSLWLWPHQSCFSPL